MLLCCTGCGRIKGTKFPLVDGQPELIDPTIDDPWQFLDFDPLTGNIVPRYDPDTRQPTIKGEQTVIVLQLDRREAMANGYQRTFRRIRLKIEDALPQPDPDAAVLIRELIEADDHGLLGWCFDGAGVQVPPFADLQASHPAVWDACRQAYMQR